MLRMYVTISEFLRRMARDASGATGIEYGFVAGGIAMIGVTAAELVGDEVAAAFGSFTGHLSPSTTAAVVQ